MQIIKEKSQNELNMYLLLNTVNIKLIIQFTCVHIIHDRFN